MINILFFVSGCILTSILFLYVKKRKKVTFLRRGLLQNSYSAYEGGSKESVVANLEVAEIESTEVKSKVKVLEISFNNSKYNTTKWKEKIKTLVDNTWINTSDIEWINKSKSTERAEKLDKILN